MAVLYVTEPYATIKKDGDTLVIHIPASEKGGAARKVTVPLIKVEEVVIIGDSTLTPQALAALLDQQVVISFLSAYGQFRGRVEPGERKNSPLRLAQVRVHDDVRRSFALAKQFVLGKLHNKRTMLLRANRRLEDAEVAAAAGTLREIEDQVEGLESDGAPPPEGAQKPQAGTALGSLQGLEGAAAARYFSVFGRLLRADSGLSFDTRTRRPPRDPVNALLSYAYTLLLHQAMAALQVAGLDPYIGFLHSAQYSKPSLALDLMEEFRPVIADSVVLNLINNRVLGTEDFIEEFGAWRLKDGARRTFLQKFEERMNTEIRHPEFDYPVTYRRCMHIQARLLAKVLLGELERYVPFKVR